MLARASAELPERFLQTFGQGGEALTALNGANMLPAREGKPEVIEHMPERLAANRHGEAVGMGEVGQRLAARRMLLAEDQRALRAFGRAPVCNVPLQGAQDPIRIAAGMQPLQFFKNRRGADARRGGEDRHNLGAPNILEGIDAGAILPGRPLAHQPTARANPPCCALAETRPGGRNRLRLAVLALVHVPPDLTVGDVTAAIRTSPRDRGEFESGISPTGHPSCRQASS